MLVVKAPPTYKPERTYVIDTVLGEFLGLDYRIQFEERQGVSLDGGGDKVLTLPDVLFQTPQDRWLTPASLPIQPLEVWDTSETPMDCMLCDKRIPIIYGSSLASFGSSRLLDPASLSLPIDVFGSVFFMLTRYEEAVKPDRDRHDRFLTAASLAFQEGFVDRPIVNEYMEVLWWAIRRLRPGLKRKERAFRVTATHDVDAPFELLFCSPRKIIHRTCGEFLIGRGPVWAGKRFARWVQVRRTGQGDPFDTFDWMMDQSERAGIESAFFFMAGGETPFEFPYPLAHPKVGGLIQRILGRGHEIGFHPSYATAADEAAWMEEWRGLRDRVDGERIRGGRQHYLRFRIPRTWRFWDDAGFDYDSTLCFADQAGFRCGTCYEYPVFDVERQETLRLRERPLIVMERSIMGEKFMGLGMTGEALESMLALKERCKMFNGDFVLLWHNNLLVEDRQKEMYQRLLDIG
jgi:hypothetical protein